MFDTYTEIFAERANSYHSAMRRTPAARDAEFRAVVDPVRGMNGQLCDIPAGGGYLAGYLPPELEYIGIEPVDEFRELAPRDRTTICAPITNIPLASGSVDHLISLAGLHHEQDLGSVFGEMRRLLRAGGRAVLADVGAGTPPAGFLNGFVARHNPIGHNGRFLDDATATTLEDSRFKILDDGLVGVPWLFENREEAAEFCAGLFGIVGLSLGDVADALDREIGFAEHGRGIALRWVLRRIVCEAV